jgi:hypothetical protein
MRCRLVDKICAPWRCSAEPQHKDILAPKHEDYFIKALELARDELKYRRDKQWQIFHWTVTLLAAAIGGLAALALKTGLVDIPFAIWPPRGVQVTVAFSLGVVAWQTTTWIAWNIKFERRAHQRIQYILECIKVPWTDFPDPKDVTGGYALAIWLIATGAIVTVFLVDFSNLPVKG